MSDKYTPTTEQVRATYLGGTLIEFREEGFGRFQRWLAEVERAAAERALTEAATEVEDLVDGYESTADEMRGRGEWADSNRYSNYSAGLNMAATKLRARAVAEWLKGQGR